MQENRLHSMRVRTGKSTCSRAIHAHGNRRATAAGQASSGLALVSTVLTATPARYLFIYPHSTHTTARHAICDFSLHALSLILLTSPSDKRLIPSPAPALFCIRGLNNGLEQSAQFHDDRAQMCIVAPFYSIQLPNICTWFFCNRGCLVWRLLLLLLLHVCLNLALLLLLQHSLKQFASPA